MKLKYLLPSLLLWASSALGQNTQLTGTINNVDGTGFNGILYLSLSQVAGISPNGSCGGPVQEVPNAPLLISIVNGVMTKYQVAGSTTSISGAPKIYGSDCTLPVGVPYIAQLRDLQGNIAFNQLWLVVGTTQDIGTVTSNADNPQALYLSLIPGIGAPTGICSNTQVYIQQDATPGINEWLCIRGAWTQQTGGGGGGGSGITIGNPVIGGSTTAVLFVDGTTNLGQDASNFFYDATAHQLHLLKLSVTNAITGSVTGNAGSATVATALAATPTICGAGLVAQGILANGNATGCVGIVSPAGSTNEFQVKTVTGALAGGKLIGDGVTITAQVPVILAANPTVPLGAVTKQYADAIAAGLTGAVLTGPGGNQTIIQPDGTTLSINNAGTTGVGVQFGPHVNISMGGGTVLLKSPDTLSTMTLDNIGFTFLPSVNSYITLGGKIVVNSAALNTSTTIGAAGEYIDLVDATSGSLTETLPLAATVTTGKQTFIVAKVDPSVNTVVVAAGAGDTINGAASVAIGNQYGSITLISNGIHNWVSMSTLLPTTITPGSCGDSTHFCNITYNASGQLLTAAQVVITTGLTLKTNTVTNPLQTTLDLTNGPGIIITNDTLTGKTVITNVYAQNPTPAGVFQNVDWPPSITNVMNDEFTDTVFNTSNIWTVVNQGTDTISNKNSLLSVNAVAHSGDSFVGIYQLIPSTPYAVTSKITLTGLNVSGYYGGLAVRDSASGKVVSLRIGNGSTLTVDHWASPTSLTSSVYTQTVDSTATIYMTIKDDGANFTFSISRDGVNFIPVYSESRTAFLAGPNQIGYMTGSSNATYPMTLGSDWFRRTL